MRNSRPRARSWTELALLIVASGLILLASAAINFSRVVDRWMDIPTHRHGADLLFGVPFVMALLLAYGWQRSRVAHEQAAAAIAAGREAARTNEEFRSLFTHHPHAVIAVDPQRRYRLLNPAAEVLGGYTQAEMLSRRFPSLKVREQDQVIAAFDRAMLGQPQRLETILTSRDGRDRDVDITMVPIVVDLEALGVFVVAHDITEDKRMRRELASALEGAQQASQAKSLLVANVSHELRTPLSGIIGALELLGDSHLDPQQTRLLDMATRNGQSLLRLVDDLLDLTRIAVGQIELDSAPIDLCMLLEQTLANMRPAARAKDLDVRLEIEHPCPEVLGDPLRLGQVLTNLLNNAVKFTDHGEVGLGLSWPDSPPDFRPDSPPAAGPPARSSTWSPEPTVQEAQEAQEAQAAQGPRLVTAQFRVWDTGIGICEAQHEAIFERFVQMDPTSTRRHGGVGLGLSITRRLVDLMGGSVELTSRLGEGSTFTVNLPLTVAEDTARPSGGAAEAGDTSDDAYPQHQDPGPARTDQGTRSHETFRLPPGRRPGAPSDDD